MKYAMLVMVLVVSLFATGGVPMFEFDHTEPGFYMELVGGYDQYKVCAGRWTDYWEFEMMVMSAGDMKIGAGIGFGLGVSDLEWVNLRFKPYLGVAEFSDGTSDVFYGGTAKYYCKIYKSLMLCTEAGPFKGAFRKESDWLWSIGLHYQFGGGDK